MLVLLEELQRKIAARLDAASLLRAEAGCRALHRALDDDAGLWRPLVLHGWDWLLRVKPRRVTWKKLHERLVTRTHSFFCVVGGATAVTGYARSFRLNTGAWSDLPACSEQRNMPAVVRDATGALAVVGGLEHGEELRALRTAERFVVETGHWEPLPELQVARCCCSGALDARGRLYVVGGGDNMYRSSRAYCSVEWLDTALSKENGDYGDKWTQGPDMCEPRCALGVACSYRADLLFACGGYGGAGRYLDSAEHLDLSPSSNGVWLPLPRLSKRRAGTNAAAAPDGRIFVLGGGPDGVDQHRTMEALDPRECRWQTDLAPLKVGRHYNAAAFGPDGYLYVAGAFRHTGQLDVVERYDPRADAWELLPDMGVPIMFSAGAFSF